jgi:hypothetical protein
MGFIQTHERIANSTMNPLLPTHAPKFLQNQQLRIHPAIDAVRRAGLLASVQGSRGKALPGHALLEADFVEGVDV